MIKGKNGDKEKILSYLKRKPWENGFFIGDLENFDLEEDFLDLWYEEEGGELLSVLLRYFKGYLISSEGKGDFEAMAGIIQADAGRDRVSGTGESMGQLGRFMDLGKVQKMHLALLTGETFSPGDISVSEEPIRAGVKELDELFDFLKGIEEFGIKEEGRDIFGKGIKTGTGRAYLIRREGRIAATAQITAENSCNGMVVGVATDPKWRRKGLARACVTRACRDMIGEGKDVTLFYDNPDAGKLYKDIGFRDRGSWAMCRSVPEV